MTTSSLLEDFQKYLGTAEAFDDLEIVSRYVWLTTASAEQKAAFIPIAQHHSHSLLALWKVPGSDNLPVVWLDSEGDDGVVANSFEEFLSVSAHGLGTLRDIMHCFSDDESADDVSELLELKFPPGEISSRLAEHQESVDGSRAYQQWVAEKYGVSTDADPIAVIEKANASHPTFKQWMAESA